METKEPDEEPKFQQPKPRSRRKREPLPKKESDEVPLDELLEKANLDLIRARVLSEKATAKKLRAETKEILTRTATEKLISEEKARLLHQRRILFWLIPPFAVMFGLAQVVLPSHLTTILSSHLPFPLNIIISFI